MLVTCRKICSLPTCPVDWLLGWDVVVVVVVLVAVLLCLRFEANKMIENFTIHAKCAAGYKGVESADMRGGF